MYCPGSSVGHNGSRLWNRSILSVNGWTRVERSGIDERNGDREASVGRQISGSVDDHYRWDESILREEERQPAAGSFIKKSRLKDDGYFKTGVSTLRQERADGRKESRKKKESREGRGSEMKGLSTEKQGVCVCFI